MPAGKVQPSHPAADSGDGQARRTGERRQRGVLNVTVTKPDGTGYVTVWPCASPQPDASNLNYVAGQTVPNAVIAPVDANGEVCFYTYAPTDLIADVNGWFAC